MKLKELRDFLNTLNEKQLDDAAIFFQGDNEQGIEIESCETSDCDIYWHEGELLGPLEEAKETLGEDWAEESIHCIRIPAGTVSLHGELKNLEHQTK